MVELAWQKFYCRCVHDSSPLPFPPAPVSSTASPSHSCAGSVLRWLYFRATRTAIDTDRSVGQKVYFRCVHDLTTHLSPPAPLTSTPFPPHIPTLAVSFGGITSGRQSALSTAPGKRRTAKDFFRGQCDNFFLPMLRYNPLHIPRIALTFASMLLGLPKQQPELKTSSPNKRKANEFFKGIPVTICGGGGGQGGLRAGIEMPGSLQGKNTKLEGLK